jgi:serine/threonine protein phosphatase PrpC
MLPEKPEKPLAPLSLDAAACSEAGRVRPQNQDRCLVDLDHQLFIVADGVGGQQAGEFAAEAVTTVLPPMLFQLKPYSQEQTQQRFERLVYRTIRDLSQRLRTESSGRPGLEGMGSTVVLAWVLGQQVLLAHMGDSRAYLLRSGHLSQMTQDHSVLGMLLRNREITPEDARSHPARGRLSRYVGMEGDAGPDVQRIPLYPDDRLLLCSDGLTNMVPDDLIIELLLAHPNPKDACAALAGRANQAGGTDNITVVVINARAGHNTGKTTANFQRDEHNTLRRGA